jgi:hypothetical protein
MISQHTPNIPDVEWVEIPNTRRENGSCYQADFAARVPQRIAEDLPDYCYIVPRYQHVTRVHRTWSYGREILEICHQREEGHPIECSVF